MSQFLEEFAALLSTVTRDATFARAWGKLLPQVCHHAGDHWDAGGLWLVDRDDGVTRLTLWHWWHKAGVKNLPFYVSTQLSDQKTDHIDDATLAAMVRKASEQLSANGLLPHSHSIHLAKIEVSADSGDGRTTLGALSLFSTNGQPLDPTFTRDLGIALWIGGAWMRLNREWRKAQAVAAFQSEQSGAHSINALAGYAVDQLVTFASARVAAAIYVPKGGKLDRIGYRGVLDDPVQPDVETTIHHFHFEQAPDLKADIVQLEFEHSGRGIDNQTTLQSFPEVEPGDKPVAIVMARVRDGVGNGDPHGPVIATILLATRAEVDFIGGRFSDTNREVLKLIMAAFRDSYSLALQRNRMEALTKKIDELAVSRATVQVMSEEHDRVDFCHYVKMACDWLPSVADAVIIDGGEKSGAATYWRYTSPSGEAPHWLRTNTLGHDPVLVDGVPGRWQWRKPIPSGNGNADLGFALLMTAPKLSHIEDTLFARIIAEAQMEQHLHVNRDDWANQLAEVRHNMRAALGSVLGKAKLLSDRYEVVIKSPPDIAYDRLINRGEFRKNIRQLQHYASALETIFENTRVLVGRLDEDSLQISSFNLPELIQSTIHILELEASRRRLKFVFSNRMPPDTRIVIGDPIWTRIALFNLLENAIKYSDSGSRQQTPARIEIALKINGGHWQLQIANVGRYIPQTMREAIFEPYTRVKFKAGLQAMPGTGLGLMTVKRFVELHQNPDYRVPENGRPISVRSDPIQRDAADNVTRALTSFLISIPRRGPSRNA